MDTLLDAGSLRLFLLEGEGDFVHILKGQAYTCTKSAKRTWGEI